MIKTLREYIREAESKKIAIGHFNISNLESLKGIYEGAKRVGERAAKEEKCHRTV